MTGWLASFSLESFVLFQWIDDKAILMSILFIWNLLLIRAVVQFYFLRYFNYPWNSTVVNKPSKMYQVVIISCISLQIVSIFMYCVANMGIEDTARTQYQFDRGLLGLFPTDAGSTVLQFIFDLCFETFYISSNFWILVVQSAVGYKYRNRLKMIIPKNTEDNAVDDMIEQYKQLYTEFKTDMPFVLRILIQWKIIPVLCAIWVQGYRLQSKSSDDSDPDSYNIDAGWWSWLLFDLMTDIVMLIFSGCYLNETFEIFQLSLWEMYEVSKNREDMMFLSGVIHYVEGHPIHFTFAGLRITRKNIAVFIFGFIISKAAVYFVKDLY